MAILKCDYCRNTQGLEVTRGSRLLLRDAYGRVVQEAGVWTFDPTTGRCIADTSDYSGRNQPYYRRCFTCFQQGMWVYSSEYEPQPSSGWVPPTARRNIHERDAVEQGFEAEPEHVWSIRRGGKTCQCRGGRCQLRGGGIGGCGCASSGFACSVLCGCGGRGEYGDCLSPYTPPEGADPSSKKCSCTSGCVADPNRIGSPCGCAALAIGCSDACGCRGNCRNGHR